MPSPRIMYSKNGFSFKQLLLYNIHWDIIGPWFGFRDALRSIARDDGDLQKLRLLDAMNGSYIRQASRNGLVFMQRVDCKIDIRAGFWLFPLTIYSTFFYFDTFYRSCQIDLYGPLRYYYKGISLALTVVINFQWDELVVSSIILSIILILDLWHQRDDLETRIPLVANAIDEQFDEFDYQQEQNLYQAHDGISAQFQFNRKGLMLTYSNFISHQEFQQQHQNQERELSLTSSNSSIPLTSNSTTMFDRAKSALDSSFNHEDNYNYNYHHQETKKYPIRKIDRRSLTYIMQHKDKIEYNVRLVDHLGFHRKDHYLKRSLKLDWGEGGSIASISRPQSAHSSNSVSPIRSPREEIADFQSRTLDYFQTLNRADEFISTAFGTMYVFWFLTNSMLISFEISRGWIRGWTVIKLLQLAGIPVFYSLLASVNGLNRINIRLYKQICGFMARDTSISKLRWIGLLRYYTDKHRYSWTVFRVEILSDGLLLKFTSTVISLTSFMASANVLTDIRI